MTYSKFIYLLNIILEHQKRAMNTLDYKKEAYWYKHWKRLYNLVEGRKVFEE